MNKSELIGVVNGSLEGTRAQAERVVETIFSTITETLKKGEDVSVAGFGIFSAKERAARTARNPKTGESIQVPAMRVAKFKAAKALKDAVR